MPMPFFGILGRPVATDLGAGKIRLNDETVEVLRLQILNSALSEHRREALQSLICLGIIFLIFLPLFMMYWLMAQRYGMRNDSIRQ